MTTPSKDPAEAYFPELNIREMKLRAERWVKKFHEARIKKVLLYKFSSPYEGEMAELVEGSLKTFPYIYTIVFEVDAKNKAIEMSAEERMRYDLQKIRGKRPLESYERLLDATEPNTRKPYKERYRYFISEDFKLVYKRPPRDMALYREDWLFRVKFENSELNDNIRKDEPFLILFTCNSSGNAKGADMAYDQSDFFPDLRIKQLKLYTKTHFVPLFKGTPLERVVLYGYSGGSKEYAVVFEIGQTRAGLSTEALKKIECLEEVAAFNLTFVKEDQKRDYETDDEEKPKTENEIKYQDRMNIEATVEGMAEWNIITKFRKIYKGNTRPKDYLKEWDFFIKMQDDPFPKGIEPDAPKIILFEVDRSITVKKLRPDQQAKSECQKVAQEIWNNYPILDIVHLIEHPDIKKVTENMYMKDTIHNWLKDVAPERARKPGKRDKETREKQGRICKALGIEL